MSFILTTRNSGAKGAKEFSGNGTFRLPATNIPPVVTLELPVDGTNHTPGASLLLRAAVADPDSYIARVEFRMNGALLGVRTNAPYQLTLREMPAGTGMFQAVATDDDGGVGVSGVAAVTVRPRITRIENAPGGALLHFDTLVNHALTLQATESWRPDDWTNLHSVPPATIPGPASHFDPYPSNRNARYYRLRIP